LLDTLEVFRAATAAAWASKFQATKNLFPGMIVDSAFRCAEHNKAVGGAPHSQHLLGLAADVRVPLMSAAELEQVARTILGINGIGRSTPPMTYLHIDVRYGPAVVAWTYDADGKQAGYYPVG